MDKLLKKTAVITGAASGMGKAIAELFASEGANVVLVDLHQNELDELVKHISLTNENAIGIVCDVSNEEAVKKMIESTMMKFSSLDILVNNAGIMDDFVPVESVTNELWNRVLSVNLNGPFYTCRLTVPIMVKQSAGSIINIASIGGLFGTRAGVSYTASKHALIGLTKNIGFMYALKGIRCNAIAPGGVNTNIGRNMNPDVFGKERAISGGTNMPRVGEPDEIARIALFLACNDSSFVNGSIITADGGWTAY